MHFILIVLVLTFAEVTMIMGQFPQESITNLLLKSWDVLERVGYLLKQIVLSFY